MIPYARQDVSEEDIEEIVSVLKSDFLTGGERIPRFEAAVASRVKVAFAVAFNSATSALHGACVSLGLRKGDVLWTSPNSFVASANCAIYCGATVDFVDIDPKTYNICPIILRERLEVAKEYNALPKILILVHFAGQCSYIEDIYKLSLEYGFKIIEDASHAIGGEYDDIPIGRCQFSSITVFSFHPVKIITTGEGGMAVTNDVELNEKLRNFMSHGIIKDQKFMKCQPENEIWNYQQISLGYNYRMTDIQAALGLSQLKRIGLFISRRHKIAKTYLAELGGLNFILPFQDPRCNSSFHLFPILVDEERCGKSQKQVYHDLHAMGVAVNLHYIPIYRQPYYETLGFQSGYCKNAEKYFTQTLSLPMFASLCESSQAKVIGSLKKILRN